MPRVLLPDASFIASAERSLLPFLAPRNFAESHLHSSCPLQKKSNHGFNNQKQKTVNTTRNLSTTTISHGQAKVLDRCSSCQSQNTRRSATSSNGSLGLGRSIHTSRRVGHLYADISSIARQYAREYSTESEAAIRRSPNTRQRSHQRERTTRSSQTLSAYVRKNAKVHAKRSKALALEQARMAKYRSHNPINTQQGRYRSLRRRLTNLENWQVTTIDLRKGVQKHNKLEAAFSSLDRTLYGTLQRYTRKVNLLHHPNCLRLSNKLFSEPDDQSQVVARWLELDPQERIQWSHRLLLYILHRKSSRALTLLKLLALDKSSDRRAQMIADAYAYLSKLHREELYTAKHGWVGEPQKHREGFVPAFVETFKTSLADHPGVCPQELLYNLVHLAEGDDLKKVFDSLVARNTWLSFDTLLHYADAFSRAGNFQYALRCLEQLKARFSKSWTSIVDRKRLRWTCALILRSSMSKSQEYHKTTDIIAAFVRLGINLDTLLYNVVMHNAMDASDYQTAFKVYNTLASNGLEPDKYTLSILLHGCASQNNPLLFRTFAQHCATVAKEMQDPWLATEYLNYTYACHKDESDPGYISALMWRTYLEFFSGAVFQPLISRSRRELSAAIRVVSDKLQPTQLSFYIMLQMEIRIALSQNVRRVSNLYHRFKLFAESDSAGDMAKHPAIWNAFLFAFCQKKQFASASQVMKDMANGPAHPDVYSWNMLMQAFSKDGQVHAAERAFEIMQSRGIKPDQYTYGVLLRAFARAQHIDRISDIMQHVEGDRELDPDLLQAFARILDRTRLMSTLERSRMAKEAESEAAAAQFEKRERERWQFLTNKAATSSKAPINDFKEVERQPEERQPKEYQPKEHQPKDMFLKDTDQAETPTTNSEQRPRFKSMLMDRHIKYGKRKTGRDQYQ